MSSMESFDARAFFNNIRGVENLKSLSLSNEQLQLLMQRTREHAALLQATADEMQKTFLENSNNDNITEQDIIPAMERAADSVFGHCAGAPYVNLYLPIPGSTFSNNPMEHASIDGENDFKRAIYNILAESCNNPASSEHNFIQHIEINRNGTVRKGFRFVKSPETNKRLAELYGFHVKKARLDLQMMNSVFIQDLYELYYERCLELLSNYFEQTKEDKYTFLHKDHPGDSLETTNNSSQKESEKDDRLKEIQNQTKAGSL
jgi:hypothetical protein